MLALLQYQDGFSSTNLIMRHLKIPVTNYALKTLTDLDKQQKKSREYKKLQENKRYQSRLSAALEQKRVKVPGYRAGCEDQSDVASTSLSTSISCISVPSSEQNVNEFVIIPYGPKFYIGQILEIDHVTNEFKTQTMSCLTRMEYCWKEGEAAYEAPYWEDLNLIICVISPPTNNKYEYHSSYIHIFRS